MAEDVYVAVEEGTMPALDSHVYVGSVLKRATTLLK